MRVHGKLLNCEVYEPIPRGWKHWEIADRHRELGGTFEVKLTQDKLVPFWAFYAERPWRASVEVLGQVCEGIKVDDQACIEIAIQYLELNHFASYSGHVRQRMASLLKNTYLSKTQKRRIIKWHLSLRQRREFLTEYREIYKLAKKLSENDN